MEHLERKGSRSGKIPSGEMFQTKRVLKNQGCKFSQFFRCIRNRIWTSKLFEISREDNQIHGSLLIGKSRVTSTNYLSIPRLELTAATLAIKISQLIKKELELNDVTSIREHFWTDSQVVLGYINNESKRFEVFVSNRVQLIRSNSNTN